MEPLNSPIEVGVRLLTLLDIAYPESLDVDRLTLMDYSLVHSADFGGPESLHPEIPQRESELGLKRGLVERGLQVMLRAGLADVELRPDGIRYRAREDAGSFMQLLESRYVASLRDRATWVIDNLGQIDDEQLKSQSLDVTNRWAEGSTSG